MIEHDRTLIKARYKCIICGEIPIVEVSTQTAQLLRAGYFIQDAWPEASPAEREVIQSGTHLECQPKLYGPFNS